jgi:hypothetical protein
MTANEAAPQTDELYRLVALFVGGLPVRECCAPTEIDGLAPTSPIGCFVKSLSISTTILLFTSVARHPRLWRWRTACQTNEVLFDRSVCSEGRIALILLY